MKFLQLLAPVLAFRLADAYLVSPEGIPAPGSSKACSEWVESAYSMSCNIIQRFYGATLEELQEWNPSIGDNCTLIEGLSYCVQINFVVQSPTGVSLPIPTGTTRTSTSTGGGVTSLTPSQSGTGRTSNLLLEAIRVGILQRIRV